MYARLVNLSKSNSFFLFGARATGKSTHLQQFFLKEKNLLFIDLLDSELERTLSANPSRLLEMVEASKDKISWIFIDEIQKIPKLLDIVHKLIFEQKLKFALTGSSARKLKRGNANLLAGRAFSFKLHPLTFLELADDFNLNSVLRFGSLPAIFTYKTEQDKKRYLQAYIQTYIKEEILIEQLVRNIEPFHSFLEVAAQCNGEIINYSKIAREAQIDSKNVERYFSILEDTLLGFFLVSYSKSIRKRQIQSPKFYFFDLGVTNAFLGTLDNNIVPQTYSFGRSFEHFIILEFIRLNDYFELGFRFSYLKTKDGQEIDLVLEKNKRTILVEIKSSNHISSEHLSALKNLGSDIDKSEKYILCQEKIARKVDEINIVPWAQGIKQILNLYN